MHFIAIYRTNEFTFIDKSNKESIFSLPGKYYVLQIKEMIKQYGRSYEDPFIYLDENQKPNKLFVNDIELTDTKLGFTYNSNYYLCFNLYDHITRTNKKIVRSGLYHTKALQNDLSFIIKTMTEFPQSRNWETFDITQENIKLKEEIIQLKKELAELKTKII
jgi:hypothetical protein